MEERSWKDVDIGMVLELYDGMITVLEGTPGR
jgi:hypothetical protein